MVLRALVVLPSVRPCLRCAVACTHQRDAASMTPFSPERGCIGEMYMPGSAEASVSVTPARPRSVPEDDKALREDAVRAIEEGRADHAAGRTFSLTEIKEELEIVPGRPGPEPE